jgi:polyisoprenoid-binding protein YceI
MKTLFAIAAISLASFSAFAAPQTFDFKDPKGVNNVRFMLDAPLESINGSASGISGTVTFDPENPGATKGKITVAASSLTVQNNMMKEHLHGKDWMDVAKFPEITFETKQLRNVNDAKGVITADAVGTLTIRGVAKEVTAPIKLTYLKDKLQARNMNAKGDLLVLRTKFTIKRTDFGINPGAPDDKVSDEITLDMNISGASPK